MNRLRRALWLVALVAACTQGPPGPAVLDTKNEQCAFCRMAVSDQRFAAQLVAPGEEARFFDDIGCFAGFVSKTRMPAGAVGFVADHRTKRWVRADQAIYTKVPQVATPMSSHIIAHEDTASRDLDPGARGGSPMAAAEALGASLRGGR